MTFVDRGTQGDGHSGDISGEGTSGQGSRSSGWGHANPSPPLLPQRAAERRQTCPRDLRTDDGALEAMARPAAAVEPTDEGAYTPMWMRPPQWLYLPHLQAINQGAARLGTDDGGAPVHAASGGVDAAAAGAGIQGRGQALGRAGNDGVPISDAVASGCSGRIRGLREEPGRGATAGASRAQELLDARNASVRISLNDHAERVEKRKRLASPLETRVSAADRMIALRRRLAERVARQRHDGAGRSEGDDRRGGDVEGAGSQCADVNLRGDEARDAQKSERTLRPSKEDVNMHLEKSGEADASSPRAASTTTASSVAARFAAWHGRGLHLSVGDER